MTPRTLNRHRSTPTALRPMAAAIGLALASLLAPAGAATAVAHWTVTDLGTLGGTTSFASGINAAGQVAGYGATLGNAATHAFLYSNGAMTDLGTLGGTTSSGSGINAAGQVTGYAHTTGNATGHAFLYGNGTMTDLGTLGGNFSEGFAINAAGQVTGYADISGSVSHAFLYRNGSMTDLGTLGGTYSYGFGINAAGQVAGASNISGNSATHAFLYGNGAMTDLGTLGGSYSYGRAINAAGQVAGYASTPGNAATHAFLYSNGTMTDLGSLGGSTSYGYAINAAGQVVGYSAAAGNAGQHAFVYSNGTMVDLNTLNGVAGGGRTLTAGYGINDAGQITGNASDGHAFLLTLDAIVWEGSSTGSFASGSGWTFGVAPNRNTSVFIDPTLSTTIYGPSANIDIRSLTVGGDSTGNNGIATLVLNGGTLNVLGNAGQFSIVNAKGVLTGDGTLTGAVVNQGTVVANNLNLPGGLTNTGTVTGNGRLSTALTNNGLLRVDAGQLLLVTGFGHVNNAAIEVRNGGELQFASVVSGYSGTVLVDNSIARFNGGLLNETSSRVALSNGAALYFGGTGLVNAGQLQVSFGGANVFGAITNYAGGKIILSGNSNTTFYDTVDVKSSGELRVSSGSTAVFFGQVFQRTGALFSGTGTKFYEGGLSVGASPGLGIDAGDVNFGAGNVFLVEMGGTTACTAACETDEVLKNHSFDKYVVAGHLGLGGTLKLGSWNGFVAQAGQRFDLLDWGSVGGSFDSIDASGLVLAAGLALDTSQLAIDGSFSVVSVPEPQAWALWLAGLGVMVKRMRRVQRPARLR